MTQIVDLPIDLTLYHIMTNVDLEPSDVLGLCSQPGFVLLCKYKKVGIYLMRRYYPNVVIDMNNPWRQFKLLAKEETIRYSTTITDQDIYKTTTTDPGENNEAVYGPNLPITTLTRSYGNNGNDGNIVILIKGVPIKGYRWIGGHTYDDNIDDQHKYQIYDNQEEAIGDLWDIFQDILTEDNKDHHELKSMGNRGYDVYGKSYNSPVDYRETFEDFRNDILERGYTVYYYYSINESDYGDFSDYGSAIFSVHNVEFV